MIPINSDMKKVVNSAPFSIEQMVHKITSSGKISRADQKQFMAALLSQKTISAAEEAMINRIFELLRAGRLRVID